MLTRTMEVKFPAQLYTGSGKHGVEVTLNTIPGTITYFNPEQRETISIWRNAKLELGKHGWFFSDFWVIDMKNAPPLWKHKLTFYKKDGLQVAEALVAWAR